MKFSNYESEKLVRSNELEYGTHSAYLDWIDDSEAAAATIERDDLLEKIKRSGGEFDFQNSKTNSKDLSYGCTLCGKGSWSCLFITGTCNAKCFYCPSRQDLKLNPSTNTFEFKTAESYADYVNYFGFKGVSFSGGEPFMTLQLMLKYIKAIREKCSPDTYIWIYTNGSLVTKESLQKIKDMGVNEIRFDIGAFDYSLKKAEMASGIIDNVSVEIPMVPDHFEKVISLLKPMKEAGIKHLNLHQLRVTPYNIEKMIKRNYKFVNGLKVTVFRSEINALKTVLHSIENNLVPVNYCSFLYKNSFQSSATRKRYAQIAAMPDEFITQNGYIRTTLIENGTATVIYFNPQVKGNIMSAGNSSFNVERKKIASYKMGMDCYISLYEKEDGFSVRPTELSEKDSTDISNFEILRGGFADYF